MDENIAVVYGSGASYASGYKVRIIEEKNDYFDKPTPPPTDQNFFNEIDDEFLKEEYYALCSISEYKTRVRKPKLTSALSRRKALRWIYCHRTPEVSLAYHRIALRYLCSGPRGSPLCPCNSFVAHLIHRYDKCFEAQLLLV